MIFAGGLECRQIGSDLNAQLHDLNGFLSFNLQLKVASYRCYVLPLIAHNNEGGRDD